MLHRLPTRATSDNLSNLLTAAVSHLKNLSVKVVGIGADGAANMRKSLNTMAEQEHLVPLLCMAHAMELLSKDLSKLWPDSFAKAGCLEAFFRLHHYPRCATNR